MYGVRTNDNPHSGAFNFEVYLASTGAGPVLAFSQANVPVTGGTTYPFTFYADAQAGSAGYNAMLMQFAYDPDYVQYKLKKAFEENWIPASTK